MIDSLLIRSMPSFVVSTSLRLTLINCLNLKAKSTNKRNKLSGSSSIFYAHMFSLYLLFQPRKALTSLLLRIGTDGQSNITKVVSLKGLNLLVNVADGSFH